MWTTMENAITQRPSILQMPNEKIPLSRVLANPPCARPSRKRRNQKRTQFSTGHQTGHLTVSEILINDFHSSENWLRLGSFSPYLSTLRPHHSTNAFLPNEPRKLLITKESLLKPRKFPEEPTPQINTHQRRTSSARQRHVRYRALKSTPVVRPSQGARP